MLGYISTTETPGAADLLLQDLAAMLAGRGVRLAGAVQINTDTGAGCTCDMDIRILGDDGPSVRITQSLGTGSTGCRLDAGALELAVARVEKVLDQGADLVILNKFAKQEAIGKGFRDLIAEALARGVPVLTCVPPEYLDQFRDFAGDIAQPVGHGTVSDWCLAALHDAAA